MNRFNLHTDQYQGDEPKQAAHHQSIEDASGGIYVRHKRQLDYEAQVAGSPLVVGQCYRGRSSHSLPLGLRLACRFQDPKRQMGNADRVLWGY